MILRRARLFFLVALAVAAVVLVTNFPLTTLLHDRSALATEQHQLAVLRDANASLTLQDSALSDDSTVGEIAHEDYGLVTPGQRSVVVLPGPTGAGSTGATGPLADTTVPQSDLLPSDSMLSPAGPAPSGVGHAPSGPGFWGKVLNRLEFWKSVF